MKKFLVVFLLAAVVFMSNGIVFAGDDGSVGPAPNSGDGIPDGSGIASPNGPNGTVK
ncbi:MAG: hypothetical protein KKD05_03525 [Candidatus Omnitrophica bacterium]|nr:hypothetical protein [Candidatus Omnitrophota bacterium]